MYVSVCTALQMLADSASQVQAEGIDAEAARYLRAVRDEASRIPHVCASQRRAPDPADAASSSPQAAAADSPKLPPPMTEWTYGVIQGFMDARGQVQHVVRPSHSLAWYHHLPDVQAAHCRSTHPPCSPQDLPTLCGTVRVTYHPIRHAPLAVLIHPIPIPAQPYQKTAPRWAVVTASVHVLVVDHVFAVTALIIAACLCLTLRD